MAFMNWSDKLVTGNHSIDEQHKKLVAIINELHDAMHDRQVPAKLAGIFDELLSYTASHFAHEERLFSAVGYPETAAHVAEHKDLVHQALELQAKFKSGALFVSVEVLEFLKNWISQHILKMDMSYKGLI